MKKLVVACCILFSITTHAQTAQDSIKLVVNNMFKAMKNADAGGLLDCFTDSALLQTVTKNKEGKVIVETEAVEAFGKLIATLAKNTADERIVFDAIKIDGAMANVWTPYQFYFKSAFSHCGVNNFVLVRIDNEWKIQYIIDTRRKFPCN